MWFDSHTHLYECEPVDATLARARAAGVRGLLAAGVDVATSGRAVGLARSDGVWAAVGIHPTSAAGFDDGWLEPIAELAERPGVVAIGETGLDFYRDAAPEADQRRAFEGHVELARARDLALVVHTRASVEAALALLEAASPARVVFHCWSGDRAALGRALELGAYVAFAGNVTFRSAGALRDLCAVVPGDRLLVETDSPHLAPVPHRGHANQPAHVPLVGAAVAAARGEPPEEVAAASTRNARRLFGLGG